MMRVSVDLTPVSIQALSGTPGAWSWRRASTRRFWDLGNFAFGLDLFIGDAHHQRPGVPEAPEHDRDDDQGDDVKARADAERQAGPGGHADQGQRVAAE